MGIAVVTGITGQDGSYLAELLLERGQRIVGIVRDQSRARSKLPPALAAAVQLFEWDMQDDARLRELLADVRPDSFYNLAAYARGSAMFDDPISTGEVNGLAVVRILQTIRECDSAIRFCQASSSEMFGNATEYPQAERTPMRPASPYAAAKHYAHAMVQVYRERYGLFACSAILFNHESPRRGMAYVTRKITQTAAKIRLGKAFELRLGDLEACRDWGFAPDYMRALSLMLQADRADDYVIATGETHTVREFCSAAFSHLDLDYRDYVIEDPEFLRRGEPIRLVGDSSKARDELSWRPSKSFREIVELMVDSDMDLLQKIPST